MIKRFALRDTLNSAEACELISAMIQSEFSEKDLLAYCVEGRIFAYVRVKAKRVRSTEPEICAPGLTTHHFSASGLHQITTPDLIEKPSVNLMSFCGEARAIFDPSEAYDDSDTYSPWCKIQWSEECSVAMDGLWFCKTQMESFAEEISNAKERSIDKRAEKGIGQTIAAVAALAARGDLDLCGDVPFKKAQELDANGEIEFTIGRDTFKKYFSMGSNYVIVGTSKSSKIKRRS